MIFFFFFFGTAPKWQSLVEVVGMGDSVHFPNLLCGSLCVSWAQAHGLKCLQTTGYSCKGSDSLAMDIKYHDQLPAGLPTKAGCQDPANQSHKVKHSSQI